MSKTKIQSTPQAAKVAKVAPVSKKNDERSGILDFAKDEAILFAKNNYVIMGIGALLILLGFVFMSGGASKDPKIFDAEAVYSFRRITLAPISIVAGFLVIAAGILIKPRN
jgi:uncharacterized membrane protein